MKVIDTLTQEDFHGAFQKLLERNNKCLAAGGDYFEEDESFMCALSIKVPIRKKSGNLFNDPRIYIYIYIYILDDRGVIVITVGNGHGEAVCISHLGKLCIQLFSL